MSTAELTGTKFFMNFPVTDTSHTLAEYRTRFGYQALEKVLGMAPTDVTKEVAASGLLGHGGAAFPAGRKWGVVKLGDGEPHYVCMNADEGEPGTFKDRWLMECVPHMAIEGLIIGSYALEGRHAFIYIRGEFDLAHRRMAEAIEEAYAAGLLGENILGSGYSLDVVLYRGAGSYVCGEASAMLASLEGKKGWPRNRPPRLTVKGLYQKPTVVNNVETLANVPVILRLGAAEFKKVGTPKSPGTQMISISGHIAKPGVYEIEYGYPWTKFIYEDCGGMQNGKALKCIIPGGVSTKLLSACREAWKIEESAVIVFLDVGAHLTEPVHLRAVRELMQRIDAVGSTAVFIEHDMAALPASIAAASTPFRVSLPDEAEIRKIASRVFGGPTRSGRGPVGGPADPAARPGRHPGPA
jgi:NADH-quinone oxidoreductase subunit F